MLATHNLQLHCRRLASARWFEAVAQRNVGGAVWQTASCSIQPPGEPHNAYMHIIRVVVGCGCLKAKMKVTGGHSSNVSKSRLIRDLVPWVLVVVATEVMVGMAMCSCNAAAGGQHPKTTRNSFHHASCNQLRYWQ